MIRSVATVFWGWSTLATGTKLEKSKLMAKYAAQLFFGLAGQRQAGLQLGMRILSQGVMGRIRERAKHAKSDIEAVCEVQVGLIQQSFKKRVHDLETELLEKESSLLRATEQLDHVRRVSLLALDEVEM